ncbi:YcfL family protein [Vibrio fluvialis]|uniref:YcfL family protein n=1 Tax=Vibrio fluvialis TaxID=676 RepID=UPI00050999D3|nr:YcfL family protein [Vibrio fluvialis]MBY8084516.1 YcfL family protein [Vibrio fluvialis]MDT8867234.1 YcfL family protein [Vibrio fluvialis]MDT8874645.1 YcfL family protein [Vibrio fluvialis]
MKKWFICLLSALALMGCADNTAGLRVDGSTQRVLIGDNVLAGRLSVEDIATSAFDGHTRGVVRLLSQYSGDQHLQYRFYWYDNEGLEVNTQPGPWKQIIVRGEETVSLSEVSVNPNGTQFRVQIRASND